MYKLWNTLTIGILIIGLAVSSNVSAQIYIFTSLDVPGSTNTEAMDINDSGEVGKNLVCWAQCRLCKNLL